MVHSSIKGICLRAILDGLQVSGKPGVMQIQKTSFDRTERLVRSVFESFAVIVARATPCYAALDQGCQAAQAAGDADTVSDCLTLAWNRPPESAAKALDPAC